MKIVCIDQGLAVAPSEETVRTYGLHEGDEIQVAITHPPKAVSVEERQAALARLAALSILMPPDFHFDREESDAR